MQNGKLFTGDIYSNIVISAPQLTVDEAWEAAKIASFDEDIEKMPMGMYTLISEGQGGISGGQKQRLMIARAVAPKPKILILDDSTSAVDTATDAAIRAGFRESLADVTTVIIAQRISSIMEADKILVLDEGKLVASGDHAYLMDNCPIYREVYESQQKGVE